MASMDTLIQEIYFEKQQEGSMLCAQHALNSLLRESTHNPLSCMAKTYTTRAEGEYVSGATALCSTVACTQRENPPPS